MTALEKVKAAAEDAAIGALKRELVQEVRVDPDVDWDGDPILRITIVLKEGVLDKIDGDKFLTTLVSVKRGVRNAGEERQALIEYATPSELEDDGDPES